MRNEASCVNNSAIDNQNNLLVLASASPRRHELFDRFWGCHNYQVCVPLYDEQAALTKFHSREPKMVTEFLAAGKIEALRDQLLFADNIVAVAADTIVEVDGIILGKPADEAEAMDMLSKLSDRKHRVLTSVGLFLKSDNFEQIIVQTEETAVTFAQLDRDMIEWYIKTGEPLDKAGAYGIQGFGSALIKKIDGCYYNVMGLPVNRLMNMLRQAAVSSPEFSFVKGLLPWS
ncbi:MAG: nucleoside triphosphate pyrophosphatase [Clostridiales bacterium]|jgi:septum formation protein|nr:nucleoside triphosphate pyrophosphatase [Clostridiales bacterium]